MRKLFFILGLLLPLSLQGQVLPGVIVSRYSSGGGGTTTLKTGSVASYTLNEASGNAIDDAHGYNLVNASATQHVAGKLSYAVSFTTSQYLGQLDTYFELQKMTVSFWVKTSQAAGSTQGIVDNYEGGVTDNGWSVELGGDWGTDTKANFHLNDNNVDELNLSSTTSINDGAWHHIVAVFTGTHAYLYVDHILEADIAWAHTITYVSANRFKLGCRGSAPGELFFNGTIDQVNIYNRGMAQAGVDSLWNSGNGINPYQ
jgi:hypothetical protein